MDGQRRRLGKIKRWLELEFPAPGPVRLWVGQMPKAYADCLGTYHPPENGQPAMIRLARSMPLAQAVDTLINEWTHAVTDPEGEGAAKCHGGHTITAFYPQLGRIEKAFQAALDGALKPHE